MGKPGFLSQLCPSVCPKMSDPHPSSFPTYDKVGGEERVPAQEGKGEEEVLEKSNLVGIPPSLT